MPKKTTNDDEDFVNKTNKLMKELKKEVRNKAR
jgi:hypothetical protein